MLEQFIEQDISPTFDVLFIDEAQDLLTFAMANGPDSLEESRQDLHCRGR